MPVLGAGVNVRKWRAVDALGRRGRSDQRSRAELHREAHADGHVPRLHRSRWGRGWGHRAATNLSRDNHFTCYGVIAAALADSEDASGAESRLARIELRPLTGLAEGVRPRLVRGGVRSVEAKVGTINMVGAWSSGCR
jgi:hypothetical protein